jgi:hypothetical protein
MLECKDLTASATDLASTIVARASAVAALAASKVSELPGFVSNLAAQANATATAKAAANAGNFAASASNLASAMLARTSSMASSATTHATELTVRAIRRLEKAPAVAWWKQQEKRRQDRLILASGLSFAFASVGTAAYVLYRRNRKLRAAPFSKPSQGSSASAEPATTSDVGVSRLDGKRASAVEVREIAFDPSASDFATPEASFQDESPSKARAPTPDVSFDTTETTTDASVAGDITLATMDYLVDPSVAGDATFASTDLAFAKVRVKELHRISKGLARKKKVSTRSLVVSGVCCVSFGRLLTTRPLQYTAAADSITEALDLLDTVDESATVSALRASLLNNRSVLYEQAGNPDLALRDCQAAVSQRAPSSLSLSPHSRAQKRMARLQKLVSSGERPAPSRLSFLKSIGRPRTRSLKSPSASSDK